MSIKSIRMDEKYQYRAENHPVFHVRSDICICWVLSALDVADAWIFNLDQVTLRL